MVISDDERLVCAEAGSVAPDCGRVYAGSGIWTRTRCILRTRCDGVYAPSTVQAHRYEEGNMLEVDIYSVLYVVL